MGVVIIDRVRILCHWHRVSLLVQQRGERDSQNQAVLTKLKCAAGETVLSCVGRTSWCPLSGKAAVINPPLRFLLWQVIMSAVQLVEHIWWLEGLALFVFVSGLAELASRKYKPAAKCFLQASFDHCDCPEVSDFSHWDQLFSTLRIFVC